MGRRRYDNVDDFLFGSNFRKRRCCGGKNDDVESAYSPYRGNNNDNESFVSPFGGNNNVETIVSPTETVINPTTNRRTVRRIHPTHVVNVNRNITRVENYYPVRHSVKNINSVEEYDCGSDVRNPCCRPVRNNRKNCCCR